MQAGASRGGVQHLYDIVDQTCIIPDRSGTVKLLRAVYLHLMRHLHLDNGLSTSCRT